MKIALDAQLALGSATGIGEYILGLIPALRNEGFNVTALTNPHFDPWRFDRRVIWDQVLLPQKAIGYDVLHCAAGTIPLRYRGPIVVTVHDVAWFRTQAHAPWYARYYFGKLALEQYRRAARIIVDSNFSRDELLTIAKLDHTRVSVVYPGVGADFMHVVRRAPSGPQDPVTILAVGTIEPRKNLEVVIRALPALRSALRNGVRLVAPGPATPYREACLALARELKVDSLIEFPGYVARSELLALYASATVAVVPSRYEGFGYGLAQALCAGLPVVAAATSSLPEVAGTGADLIDPSDPTEWAKTLYHVITAPSETLSRAQAARESAIARFSWERAARETAISYRIAAVSAS